MPVSRRDVLAVLPGLLTAILLAMLDNMIVSTAMPRIVGDLVPPRERGRYQGYIAAVMAVATVAGPLVGGYITDHLSWRWAFYVNLPVGAVALVLLAVRLRLPRHRTEHRIDWLGAGLLAVGITALVLITTWGGHDYPWLSWQVLGLAGLAAV